MSTMIEPSAAGLRTRCRRCQYVLPVPAEHRQGFCCRGCHRQFFAAHCRVCDKPSPNGRLHAKGCSYAHRQNPELYAFKPIQKPSDVGLEPKRARDERNPYKTSLKARAKSWGPTLSGYRPDYAGRLRRVQLADRHERRRHPVRSRPFC
jgi:hypothetical protein